MAILAPSTTQGARLDPLCIDTIRTLSMDAVQQANSGHPREVALFDYDVYALAGDGLTTARGEYGRQAGMKAA